MLMKNNFQSKAVPRGTRTIWRYLSALFLLFTFAIGNVWAAATDMVYTYTFESSAAKVTGPTEDEFFTASAPTQSGSYTVQANSGNLRYKTSTAGAETTISFVFTAKEALNISAVTLNNMANSDKIKAVKIRHRVNSESWSSDQSTNVPKSSLGNTTVTLPSGGIDLVKDDVFTLQIDLKNTDTGTSNRGWDIHTITIAAEAAASGPVDPTITFDNGAYTLGATALDLSSLFTSNSKGTVTYSVKTDGGTSASISGSDFSATAAGTCVVTATQAAETGKYNAGTADANIVVSAPAATHSVTAATEAADKGTAAAAETTVAEGATTTITASPKTGYVFDHWVVSGAGATLDDASANPVTLTMGTADATVTAYFAAKVCPTSGVLYTMTMKSKSLSGVTQNTEIALAGDYATEEGGVSYIGNKNSDAGKAQIKTDGGGTVYFNGNDAYVKIVLDCPLKADDKITFVPGSGTKQVCFTTTNTRTDTYQTSSNTFTVSSAFLATAADPENVTTLYVWRIGSSTYLHSLTITRPYEITFANGGHGTVPSATTGFEIDLTQITGVEGWVHTGWTANKVVKVGGSDVAIGTAMAVDATAAVSDDTQFTAVWTEDIPAVDPTITFNNGAYTIGGTALDLSTLFSSNSTGAVTYTVKTDGGTSAAIDGTSFTASAAGTAVLTASQAAAVGYNAATADANIVVSAPSEPDGIKLVEAEALTGNYRTSCTLSSTTYTIAGLTYNKYIKFGSSVSSWSAVAGPSNKYLAFTPTKKTTNFYFYVHNNSSTASYINLYLIEEGNATPTKVQVPVAGSENALKTYELNITKNTEVYITAESNNVYYCQVIAVESGDALLQAPAVGYVMNLNKGRLSTASNTETTLEGLTFKLSSGYSIASGSNISIGTKGTHYVSFTIPTGQTRQLQLTTSNTAKYTVSKTLGDDANQITPVANEAKNFNLAAGTWYINPQGSNVNITNIAFAATPDPITVEFDSKGGSAVASQALFVGDKVTAPSPAPTKDGHRLLKWQKGGADYDFDTELVAGDAPGFTLDAVWQKTWTVTFDSDGGSDVDPVTVDDGAKVTAPDPAPTKAGNDFDYWYKVTGETGQEDVAYVFSTMVGADMTLKAHWTPLDNDASISALSYDGNAIDLASGVEVAGVMTFNVLLPWGATPDEDLISVTKSAESATVGTISYDSESKTASFTVTAGDLTTTADYAIVFANDVKKGTSIVKAVVAGGDQSAGFDATGIYGDKGYANTRSNKKLDTAGKFVGVKLLSGNTFAAGDKLFVVTSTAADMGYIELYNEAAGTNLIKATGVRDASAGIEIPSELVGLSEFYIVRKASTGDQAWNGFVDYVEVTREMNPAIKSFKFGDNAATINEAAKTISIDVPYLTDVTALTPTVEAYGNNGATYTPAGATDFTAPVDYVVTDGYNEFNTTYAVTVNVAGPSENANLASLAVAGYTLDFDPAVITYNVVLDYGTTALPEITYTLEDATAEAVKVEGDVNGETTITVTPQAGESYKKVYTINFSVSTQPKYVIYDGSKGMTAFSATSFEDEDTHFAWAIGSGITPSADNVPSTATYSNVWGGKTYTKMLKGFKPQDAATTQLTITVPENYLAKIRLVGTTNSNESMRKMFVSKEASRNAEDALDGYIIESDSYNALGLVTNYLLPGVYYIGSTDSYRLYELSIQLYPIDYSRNVTEGRYGTICLPNGGVIAGATIFEIAYMDYQDSKPYKIYFDEVLNGEMVAGMPYIFLPKEGASQLAVTYTDAAAAEEGHHNGLYGKYTKTNLADNDGIYILKNNQYWYVNTTNVYCEANRAYIKLAEVPDFDPGKPAYGRRRVALGVNSENAAQGFENIESGDAPMKVMIDGNLYILRGEKVFDATGRLIK